MEEPNFSIPTLPLSILGSYTQKYFDIAYAAQSYAQRLDLYFPNDKPGPYPLIVHFHGGAFMFGTKRDINLLPILRSLDQGYALASVEYRLSGEARFPALVYDCKAAIRYLRAHASALNIDPDMFIAWGPSAGGYLAAMMGVTGGNPAFEDLSMGNPEVSSQVQAVVDWCGPTGDFCLMDNQVRTNGIGAADHDHSLSPESRLLGCAIQRVRELSRLAAPITHVGESVPPFLIQHGEADGIVPFQQSIDFADRIARIAGKNRVTLRTYVGKGHHGEPWFDYPDITDEVFKFLWQVRRMEQADVPS